MVSKVLCLGSFGGWRVWNTCQPLAFLAALEKTYLVELPYSSCHSFHLRFGKKILLSIFFFFFFHLDTLELNFEAILELRAWISWQKISKSELNTTFWIFPHFFQYWQSSKDGLVGWIADLTMPKKSAGKFKMFYRVLTLRIFLLKCIL